MNFEAFAARTGRITVAQITLLALIFWGLVFWIAPLYIVLVNPNIWWLGAAGFLTYGGLVSLFLAAAFAAFRVLRPVRPFLFVLLLTAILFYFVMIVFYPHQGGILDGRVEQEKPATIVSVVILLVAVFALAVSLPTLAYRIAVVAAGLTAAFGIAALLIVKPAHSIVPAERLPSARAAFERAGSEANVFVFLIDMLQGSLLEQALRAEPGAAQPYDGFQFFTRAVLAFPVTGYSVPNLLSGRYYNESISAQVDVLAAALRDSFITDARSKGFATHSLSYEVDLPLKDRPEDNLTYATYLDLEGTRRSALVYSHLLLASLQRNTKIPARAWEQAAVWALGAVPLAELSSLGAQKVNSRDALTRWTDRLSVGPEPKKLFFQHHMFVHQPVLFRRNGEVHPNTPTTVETTHAEYLHGMDLVARALERLKTLGLYDRSLIVVVGDHGHNLSNVPGAAADPSFAAHVAGGSARVAGAYNPAMLIKLPGARGPMQLQTGALALNDVRRIIQGYLGAPGQETSANAFSMAEDAARENVVFIARREATRNYWFSEGYERLSNRGNAEALSQAFQAIGQSPSSTANVR